MGFTYFNERDDRLQDERWHLAIVDNVPLYDPMLTQFSCFRCSLKFATREELEIHQKINHNFQTPTLLLNGKLQRYHVSLRSSKELKSIEFQNTNKVWANDGIKFFLVTLH